MEDHLASPRPWTRVDRIAAAATPVLGVAPVVLITGQWLATWTMLGRRPVPSIDDPKSFGGLLDLVHAFATLAVVALPPVWLGLAAYWWVRHRRSRAGKILAAAAILLPLASAAILRADPLEITTWWMD
jgi:hypothetical protein